MDNIFHRTGLLIGNEAAQRLKESHVAVFGLGGVGSYACESLVRAGVGKLTVIDFDTVGVTNINRQNIAFIDTIGRLKADIMAEKIALINPDCQVEKICEFFSEDNCNSILDTKYDAVIDAIDSFNPKVTLLFECLKRKIPVFSAMGAAGKIDPSQIRANDISESIVCPLAKRVRKKLRTFGIESGFQVIYSTEPPILPFSPKEIEEEKREVDLKRGRERQIQGSISYLTGIFGFMLAGLVIQNLTGLTTARETGNPYHLRKSRSEYQ